MLALVSPLAGVAPRWLAHSIGARHLRQLPSQTLASFDNSCQPHIWPASEGFASQPNFDQLSAELLIAFNGGG